MDIPLAVLLQQGDGAGGAIAGLIGGLCGFIIGLAIAVAFIYGTWQAFEKAGEPGWKAIVPIYNVWTLAEIVKKPGWYGLLLLISPLNLIFGFLLGQATAEAYGKPESATMYAILGLISGGGLPMVIVGYGDAEYTGGGMASVAPPAL